jgi:ribosomal-protein-alanine N-acetyltransferase
VTARGRTPDADLRIAPLELDDLPAVALIEELSFPTPWSVASFRYELVENPYASLYGLRIGEGPILAFACVWVIDQEFKINNLAVHPRFRGQGLGGRLLSALLRTATDQGCLEATLEVRPSNEAALRLYGAAGFRVVGRRRGYYSDTHEDALVMACALGVGERD